MTETPDAPASRYGREPVPARTRQRIIAVLAALVVLVTLAAAVRAYQRFEGKDVEGSTAAYKVIDDRTVSVTISVTRKDPARPVVCIVRARSADGAETGRREIVVAPAQAKTVQVSTTVTAFRRPVMGDIYGCGTDIPGYLTGPA